jgi:hypothetical protein
MPYGANLKGTSRGDHDLASDLADSERAVCRVACLENLAGDESWRSYQVRPTGYLKLGDQHPRQIAFVFTFNFAFSSVSK